MDEVTASGPLWFRCSARCWTLVEQQCSLVKLSEPLRAAALTSTVWKWSLMFLWHFCSGRWLLPRWFTKQQRVCKCRFPLFPHTYYMNSRGAICFKDKLSGNCLLCFQWCILSLLSAIEQRAALTGVCLGNAAERNIIIQIFLFFPTVTFLWSRVRSVFYSDLFNIWMREQRQSIPHLWWENTTLPPS